MQNGREIIFNIFINEFLSYYKFFFLFPQNYFYYLVEKALNFLDNIMRADNISEAFLFSWHPNSSRFHLCECR